MTTLAGIERGSRGGRGFQQEAHPLLRREATSRFTPQSREERGGAHQPDSRGAVDRGRHHVRPVGAENGIQDLARVILQDNRFTDSVRGPD